MSDELKNTTAQVAAWFAAIVGTVSFEMWLAIAGLMVSAFIAYTNYSSRKLQDALLLAEAKRSVELHDLEMRRMRAGLGGPPADRHAYVKEFVSETATARIKNE